MERRTEDRVTATQPVQLKVLGESVGQARVLPASMSNFSGRGMQLYTEEPIPLDSAVQVEMKIDEQDALLLGEVRYCLPEGARFRVGLHLEHSLLDLTSLGRLVHRLLREDRESQREPLVASVAHSREVDRLRPA